MMKWKLSVVLNSKRGMALAVTSFLLALAGECAAAPLPYHAGDVIGTNFGLQNRLLWTNDLGQIYSPSNTTIRLYDFAGKIVFFCFFDVW